MVIRTDKSIQSGHIRVKPCFLCSFASLKILPSSVHHQPAKMAHIVRKWWIWKKSPVIKLAL